MANRSFVSGSDQIFDVGAIEVGALDLVGALIDPVHLALGQVQGHPEGVAQSGGDQVFHLGAVEVGRWIFSVP